MAGKAQGLVTKDGRLPEGFVLAKPVSQENYDEAEIYRLERQGQLIITRKRDGYKMFAVFGRGGRVRLFTDGLNEVDERFDHIKRELESLKLKSGTVLVGEAIVDLKDSDDFGMVASVFKSSTAKSIAFQKANGLAKFMVFNMITPVKTQRPYDDVYCEIYKRLGRPRFRYLVPAPVLNEFVLYQKMFPDVLIDPGPVVSYDDAKRIVVEKGWEGLVLYDKDYILEYRLDGKEPKRPEGCYKWKPIMEDDFIVREWIARPDGTVKELVLLQIDRATDTTFYCGKLGSFSNSMRKELAEMKYPIVVQTRFDMRFSKTGKIRNPRFMRVRDDKPITGCVSPKSYIGAEFPKELGYCGDCKSVRNFAYEPGSLDGNSEPGRSCEKCCEWYEGNAGPPLIPEN